ncbi:exosome complex exonuclease Rrp41 [archaeon CG10_big_fil_rev_8_21_14_0_10_43_11]|nr:MAG: exosome complex exonuclease Rrp41 [archaeon CG10_big_fil_rev_8_21_14_0_10_43_11]
MAYKKRLDGRKFDQMRDIDIKLGVVANADGSAQFSMGRTKIIAAVYGPKTLHPQRLREADKGIIRAYYRMLPFSVSERKTPRPGRREIELSMVIKEALEESVFLEEFGQAVIDVHIYVVQADAGSRCASICAATLALADAGIPMKDFVASVSAGVVDGEVVLDLNYQEEAYEDGDVVDMPIAYVENLNKVTLLQLDGKATEKQAIDALKLGIEGCKIIKGKMQNALKQKFA